MPYNTDGLIPVFYEPNGDESRLSSARLMERSQRQAQGRVVSPHGRVLNDEIARADSCTAEDSCGLIRYEHRDQSDRPISEYELARGRDKKTGWMAPFMTSPRLMVVMSGDRTWNETRRTEFLAEHPAIAALQMGEIK